METLSSGYCSSDYSYCKCKDDFHIKGRCKGIVETKEIYRTTYPGEPRQLLKIEEVRCLDKEYDGSMGCTKHISRLEKAQKDVEHEKHMEDYSNKKAQEALDREIKQAITTLETNGYKVNKK